jgi:ParB family chromosome partitioning protein
MNKQRHLVGKAKLCETRLTFAITAARTFFADEHFVTLLRAEGLDTLPAFLHDQITGKQVPNG